MLTSMFWERMGAMPVSLSMARLVMGAREVMPSVTRMEVAMNP